VNSVVSCGFGCLRMRPAEEGWLVPCSPATTGHGKLVMIDKTPFAPRRIGEVVGKKEKDVSDLLMPGLGL
jgi:hypothetical protein